MKTWKKKLTKENMAIMALLGILLMVIAIPVKKTETQKDQTAAPENKSTASGTQETEEEDNTGGYAGELEERLESLLASMEGVGNVKVMVTLDSSREQVVEKDIPSTMDTTKETDSTGGSRDVINSRQEETTVYVTDSAGNKTPYVSKIREPSIEGVTVVAQGGGNAVIQKNITEVIQALFGIEAHKIKVVKMK
ncbi:stage III sporulation protein AG [Eisenbergiella massiliensis]|uniref:Stage III sporulation protein AG n=1 Tax=Eisenbergiella massiliensis TaxID=1720294 RepID=A0A3E3HWT4_9FIRM|nr:stage III sporulation protein AG [Eisenbergiella massiliensis]